MIDNDRQSEPLPHALKLAYKPSEAAALLSISERSLWSLMNDGRIKPFKLGRSVLYAHSELVRFVEEELAAARKHD